MKTMVGIKRWQDWGNLLLGFLLFISPWVMQYPDEVPGARLNAHLMGAVIVIFAAIAMYMPRIWEEGFNLLWGIWMIVSPWVLGFAAFQNVATVAVIIGLLVAFLAAWAILHDKWYEKMHGPSAAP